MQVNINTQLRQDRNSSSDLAGSGNKSHASAFERLASSPTTADGLAASPTAFDSLFDQALFQQAAPDPAMVSLRASIPWPPEPITAPKDHPIALLQDRVEELEAKLETATGIEKVFLTIQLSQARSDLKI